MLLHRAGIASKFDLVDITNIILTEYGQPMHAFDADKITGQIVVRYAKNGEKILALNATEYELTEKDLVIADEDGPIAIAGIIGGEKTAISETTTRVLWESATFDATTVRLTAQRIALRTDASTRYEKSLDPILSLSTFERVMNLLKFLNKNPEIKGEFRYLREDSLNHITLDIPFDLITKKSGVQIPHDKIETILTSLGFLYVKNSEEKFSMKVPSWRASKDISIAEDIVEEVLRIYGYENFPAIPLSGEFTIQAKNTEIELENSILEYFSNQGWNEVYNYSFTNLELEEKIFSDKKSELIAIQNAYTEDFTHMATTLAPHLLMNISENFRHNSKLRFFELGKIYGKNIVRDSKITELLKGQKYLPFSEKRVIAAVTTRDSIESTREFLDRFFTKFFGFIPTVTQGTTGAEFFHPGISGTYSHNDKVLAKF